MKRERILIAMNQAALSIRALAHILFGKPVPTFPGYGLVTPAR